MGLLCRPLQRDSGSRRLPLPGEVGLEILYQPQRTWFPNHSKSGFVLFFLPFSLSQALFPCLAGWQVFQLHPARPGTRCHCVPYPGCFPPSEGKACRAAGGHVVAQEGTTPASPVLEDLGEVGHLGAHPTCGSLNAIPACPAEPAPVAKLISRPSEGKGGGTGAARPGDAHRHAWKGSVLPERSRLVSTNSPRPAEGARLQPPGL